ncbi:MAG TPA: hypothetical protein VFE47_07480 [Tepidisphaeraceae bacterium]|nr:hypothetical protein [Tepidisphaeraceae bacterium]
MAQLMDDIVVDRWRHENPFTPEMSRATEELFSAGSDSERQEVLAQWFRSTHQPCLFARIAVKDDRIRYCFITDEDLTKTDRHLRSKIATRRLEWHNAARDGLADAFVISVVSNRLVHAEPNTALKRVARHLCHLYLQREINEDVREDETLPLKRKDDLMWYRVGVDYFGAHADRRWYCDHRIPGGIMLTANSVGHMAACVRLGIVSTGDDEPSRLWWALRTTMSLIDKTQPGPTGRCTYLQSVGEKPASGPFPFPDEVKLPKSMEDKNFEVYGGLYHTDHTIRSSFFRPDSEPPAERFADLDLTYLYDDAAENEDFHEMSRGY